MKEVRYDIYCPQCRYFSEAGWEDPCNTCLEVGMREGTEKPECFKDRDSKRLEHIFMAYEWLCENLPELMTDKLKNAVIFRFAKHEEMNLYPVLRGPNYWCLHISRDGLIVYSMGIADIIEMICAWWSFSFEAGDLYEIFRWYDRHRNHMIFTEDTRETIEDILYEIRKKLDEDNS